MCAQAAIKNIATQPTHQRQLVRRSCPARWLPNLQSQTLILASWHLRKCLVTADQNGVQGDGMGGDHHVKVAEIDALGFQHGAKLAVTSGHLLIPRQHVDTEQHLDRKSVV